MNGADIPALPSGVVAFLFSDIEGSTALLHRLGHEYGSHLEQYRVLLSDSFARHGGVRLGSEGDSLFVGFERVSGALRGAVEGQLALAHHQARMSAGQACLALDRVAWTRLAKLRSVTWSFRTASRTRSADIP